MALFTINRYMGEDDTPESATPSSPDVLLSNLYKKVQRKKLLQERRNDGLLSTDEKVSKPGIDTVSKHKKRKKKNKEGDEDKEKDEDSGTEGVISSKHKTETRKEVSDGTENEGIDGESHDVQKGLKRTSNINDEDNNSDSLPVIEATRDKVTMPRAEKKKKRDKRKSMAEEEQKDEGKVSVKNAKKSKKKRKVLSESLETEINGESVQCQGNVTRPATVDDDEVDDDNENDDDDRTLTKKRKMRESSPSTATSVNQNLQDKIT
ncbi:uncharacterized protein DDB_G0286299-like [Ptychodera flava]|uniref:uncharacterized protein DDB_G0286299-like n=1 Tax=Ptychodera flava TaxID=63121 RepID=UPI00396A7DD9